MLYCRQRARASCSRSTASPGSTHLLRRVLAKQQHVHHHAHVLPNRPLGAREHLDAHVERGQALPLKHALLAAAPLRLLVACTPALVTRCCSHVIAHAYDARC